MHLLLHTLINDTLMGGVHIDNNQATCRLGKNVNAMQLGDGKTQRRNTARLGMPVTPGQVPGGLCGRRRRWRVIHLMLRCQQVLFVSRMQRTIAIHEGTHPVSGHPLW